MVMAMEKNSNNNNVVLTDLHCHILPGIDDGAKDSEVSLALLQSQYKQGVRQIIFTPHFYPNKMELKTFLKNRNNSAASIVPILQHYNFVCGLGAEVHMTEDLLNLDLRKLAFTDTNYILIEWPFGGYPMYGDLVIDKCFNEGLIPIFAHIERYEYFFNNLDRVRSYIEKGCVMQMNADTVLSSEKALEVIDEGCIHILSTDAHNMTKRKPHLLKAFEELDEDTANRLIHNADNVFNNKRVHRLPRKQKSFFDKLFG